MFREGLPQAAQIAGFVLAAAGIWLISRTEDDSPPEGIGMAALAGDWLRRILSLHEAGRRRLSLLVSGYLEDSIVHAHRRHQL